MHILICSNIIVFWQLCIIPPCPLPLGSSRVLNRPGIVPRYLFYVDVYWYMQIYIYSMSYLYVHKYCGGIKSSGDSTEVIMCKHMSIYREILICKYVCIIYIHVSIYLTILNFFFSYPVWFWLLIHLQPKSLVWMDHWHFL
jgi:hypothetical protein